MLHRFYPRPLHLPKGVAILERLLEKERIRAEVDVLLAFDQLFDEFRYVGVEQRFSAWNRDHGSAAVIDRLQGVLETHIPLQDVGWILNLAASGTSQVATEQRLQHEYQRIVFLPRDLLLEHIARYGPHL